MVWGGFVVFVNYTSGENLMKIFVLCKPYLLKYKLPLIVYLSISVFVGLFAMVNPFLIGNFIDSLIAGGSMAVVYRFSIIFAGLNVVRTGLSYITMIIYTKTQSRSAHEFSQDVIAHVQGLSLSFVNKRDTNYLSQVINGDTNMLIIFCISVVNSFILNSVYFIVPLIILIYLNAYVTLVLMIFMLVYIFIYIKFKKPLFNRSMAQRVAQNAFFANLLEQLKLTRFIKINVLSRFFRGRMDNSFDELIDKTLKMQKLGFLYSSLDTVVTTIVQIALFLLGGYLILNGNFSIGMFTIFSMYFNMMLGAAKYFFDFGKSYQDNLVSYNRLSEILLSEYETCGFLKLDTIDKILVSDLSFSYDESEKNSTLSNFSYEFSKGNIYGIIGKNGAGKTTLVNLLIGMYIDEKQGEIRFNGISSKELDMVFLRDRHIGLSEQEPVILNENFDNNIKLLAHENKKIDLERYLSVLNLDELASKMQKDDKLSPLNFSGGEKQKLSILRVLLKDASIMFFDEPTSAMDIESGAKFMRLMREMKHDKIIIIISHDESAMKECDYLIHL